MPESSTDVCIVAARRTPMGGLLGELATVPATDLGAAAISAVLADGQLAADAVDEVYMGNVLAAGLGQAPARQAALGAGLAKSTACTTVSKVCGSGMKALMLAHDQIKAGSADTVVAGGMESMSRAPYLLAGARAGMRLGHGDVKDHMFFDGLEDAYSQRAMGEFAQETADSRSMTREAMDEYALQSLARANRAIEGGHFQAEICPVQVRSRKGDISVEVDEQPGKARPEKIPQLRPAFASEGTITAANASSISDGAAALLLMSAARADKLGLAPMAKIVGHSVFAQEPGEFTLAPIGSIQRLLGSLGWAVEDVDLFEINEAFAMVTMLAMQDLGLDHSRVNIHGGACALGHPIGASGARIVVTLLHALRQRGERRGVASLCIGGGEATSLAIELMA